MRPTALALALALASVPALAHAQEDPAGFGGLAEDAGAEVEITADDLEVDENDQTALFSGNVLIVQGGLEMRAPQVLANYGEGGPSDLESFTASGGRVEMEFDDQTAVADQARYDFADRVLTMSGNVVVTNPTGTVNSAQLVIDTRAGTSSFSGGGGGEGGRVRGVFTPGQ